MYLLQELARGLQELLSYEGNVEEDFNLTFQVRERFIIQSQNRNKEKMWKMFYNNDKHPLLLLFLSLLSLAMLSLLSLIFSPLPRLVGPLSLVSSPVC